MLRICGVLLQACTRLLFNYNLIFFTTYFLSYTKKPPVLYISLVFLSGYFSDCYQRLLTITISLSQLSLAQVYQGRALFVYLSQTHTYSNIQ